MGPARLYPVIAALAVSACLDGLALPTPSTGGALFLLTVDAQNRVLSPPEGPFFGAQALPLAVPLSEGHTLLLLEVDEAALLDRFPAYDVSQRERLRLELATRTLDECAEGGVLEDDSRLLVPIASVEDSIRQWELRAGALEAKLAPPPAELALAFEARVCQRGPRARLVPFAENHLLPPAGFSDIGGPRAIAALDSDTLLVFGSTGVARSRRGLPLRGERDLIGIHALGLPDRTGFAWALQHGALSPVRTPAGDAELIVVAMLTPHNLGSIAENDRGAAIGYLTLDPEGGFEVREVLEIPRWPDDERISLRYVHFEADGSFAAVGHTLVVTASSARARPEISKADGFRGQWILPFGEPGARHIVLARNEAVFEGDLFEEFSPEQVAGVGRPGGVRFRSATRLVDVDRAALAGDETGRLWLRQARNDWTSQLFDLPTEAAACAGVSRDACGRSRGNFQITTLIGLPNERGVLIGSYFCGALFWKSRLDTCVSAEPTTPAGITFHESVRGPTAMLEHEGRIYVGAGGYFLYEVLLED